MLILVTGISVIKENAWFSIFTCYFHLLSRIIGTEEQNETGVCRASCEYYFSINYSSATSERCTGKERRLVKVS